MNFVAPASRYWFNTVGHSQRYCVACATPHHLVACFFSPFLNRLRKSQGVGNPQRLFSTASTHRKSGGKQHSKSNVGKAAQKTVGLDDPFNFTNFEAAISKTQTHLKSEILKIKAGGRDAEAIEGIRVNLGKGKEKGKGDVVRVGDLASVVARGRNVVVLVGEKDVC